MTALDLPFTPAPKRCETNLCNVRRLRAMGIRDKPIAPRPPWQNPTVAERVESGILHDVVPKVSVLGVLINPNNWRHQADADEVQAAARTLGLSVHIAKAGSEGDFDVVFAGLVQHHAQALVIAGDAFFFRVSTKLVALAEQHSLAAIFPTRDFADAGGLMSYAASLADAHHQAGVYVGRILKGEKPGDLPVMQPSKFELVINLKTAKALGLEIPSGVLAIADEVIE